MWHWEHPEWDSGAAQRIVEAAVAEGHYRYPHWRWPALPSYQGFTSEERIRGWQKVWIARQLNLLPAPTKCSICLCACVGQYHSEDYSRPLEAKPVCRRCHAILHQRFMRPEVWRALRNGQRDREGWFSDLSVFPEERPRASV